LFILHATIQGWEGDKQQDEPEDLPDKLFIAKLSGERQAE